jgi:hypothetical protein
MKRLLCLLALCPLALTLAPACSSGGSGGGGGGTDRAEAALNESIDLGPNESAPLVGAETDESIQVENLAPAGKHVPIAPGSTMTVTIPFSAPEGNVIGAGIRFGANGPVRVVSLPDYAGQTQGSLSFSVAVPASVCNSLSSICHDIKCYEFAVTSAGLISRANITAVALQCGACDEPSCKDLLDQCGAVTVTGTWQGNCPTIGSVGGTFTMNVDSEGNVSGTYTRGGSSNVRQLSGSVQNGQLAASGDAGECGWTGSFGSDSASGTWSCGADDCQGSWSGTISGGS